MRGMVRATLGAALVVAAGCGGENGTTGLATGGNGQVVVTVGSGVTPTFSWDGGNARRLTVTGPGGAVFWDVEALDGSVGFPPPVTHGALPSQGRELTQEVVLTAGLDYTASVVLVDGSQGTRVFRP